VISKVAHFLHRIWKLLRGARLAMSYARHESGLVIVFLNLEVVGEAWLSRLVAVIDDLRDADRVYRLREHMAAKWIH